MRRLVLAVPGIAVLGVVGPTPPAAHADAGAGVLHAFPGLDIIETHNEAIYSHGGPPAKIDHMRINLEVRDRRAHSVAVKRLVMLASCDPPARKPLKLRGHELRSWDKNEPVAKGATQIVTPAKPASYSLRVAFDAVITTTGCAYALDLVVDGKRAALTLSLTVTREADGPD